MAWTVERRFVYFQNSELYHQYCLFRQLSKFEVLPSCKTPLEVCATDHKVSEIAVVSNTRNKIKRFHSSLVKTSFPPIVNDKSSLVRSQTYPKFLRNISEEDSLVEDIFQEDLPSNNSNGGRESVLEFKTDAVEEELFMREFENLSPGSSLTTIEAWKDDYLYEVCFLLPY